MLVFTMVNVYYYTSRYDAYVVFWIAGVKCGIAKTIGRFSIDISSYLTLIYFVF